MEKAQKNNVKVHLPIDFVTANLFSENAKVGSADLTTGIKKPWLGLDIGPKSIDLFKDPVSRAKIIVWNGLVCIQ